jgi:Protein of unknown function (DUF1822)
MFNASVVPARLNLMQSETIWLEPNQFEQARRLTSPSVSELGQWQMYLNALALLGFEQWLHKHASTHSVDRTQCINDVGAMYNLKIDEFKLTLIAKEHVLDELAEIPRTALSQPERAAHFYVLLEISEEQEQMTIRGFLRYDRLIDFLHQPRHPHPNPSPTRGEGLNPTPLSLDGRGAGGEGDIRARDLMHDLNPVNQQGLQDGYYQIPLSVFDPDPNHLLYYCDFLDPAAIPLPTISTARGETLETAFFQETRIKLGQWLQGVVAEGWQAIDDLINPEAHLALSLRNQGTGAKRGKLIDLGIQLQGQSTVLLLNITEDAGENLSVLVQLHPVGQNQYLPPHVTLTLLSQSGEMLQEVCSRTQDNYIQLKSFKGRSGTPFSIMIRHDDFSLCEDFEL